MPDEQNNNVENEQNKQPAGGGDPYSEMRAADILPEEFKGRDPAEVRLLLSRMPQIVKAQKEELQNLRMQLSGGTAPTVTHGAPDPEPQKSPEERAEEFAEKFDKNPMEAIRQFVEEEYAPQLSNINQRVGETEFRLVKQTVDDFEEYEDDVRALLEQSRSPATQGNIMAAYAMAVGQREIQKREQRVRQSASSPPANPAPDPTEKTPELTPLQAEVASSMGLTPEEFIKYSDGDSFNLKIRT